MIRATVNCGNCHTSGSIRQICLKVSSTVRPSLIIWGGSLILPEATGYGNVYFAQEMLKTRGETFEGKVVAVPGSGNVAQFTVEKVNELGGKCVTLSDSNGFIYDSKGIYSEKLKFIMWLKNELWTN